MVQESARSGARDQWNARACGELEGTKDSVEYFDRVAAERYAQQSWQHEYFDFGGFRDKNVLEIGIGQGTDLLQFGLRGARCHGVDITDNHIELTRRNFALRGIEVDIRKVDATAIPFPDGYFDVVYSFGVIHHIPEAQQVLAEVRRVLKPGGVFYVAMYYRWSAFHLFTKLLFDGLFRGWLFSKGYGGLLATIESGADGVKVKPYVKLYSRRTLRKLLSGLELRDISVRQLEPDHFSPLLRWLVPGFVARKLDHLLGWYVVAEARRIDLPEADGR